MSEATATDSSLGALRIVKGAFAVFAGVLPEDWHIGKLTMAAIFMGLSELAFCVGIIAPGHFRLGLGIAALQTLAVFTLVCGNQATTYAVRAHGRIWASPHPPAGWSFLLSLT